MNRTDYVDVLNGNKTEISGCFGEYINSEFIWNDSGSYKITSSRKCFLKREDIIPHNFEIFFTVDGIQLCTAYMHDDMFLIDGYMVFKIIHL